MRRALLLSAGILVLAGCNPYDSLPRNQPLTDRPRIPAGTAPVHAWQARSPKLDTYWGPQHVAVRCRGWLPADWKQPGDGAWELSATNHEGKPVPFLGVIRPGWNADGSESREILPPVKIGALKDGLYILLEDGVKLSPVADERGGNRIIEICPVARVVEVRGGRFRPWEVPVPLVPEKPGELTPAPAASP